MGFHRQDERHQKTLLRAAKLNGDQRGAVLLMTVMLIFVILALAGLATDFARMHVSREEMYSAVDAAALAGSLTNKAQNSGAVRYVSVTIRPGYCETCCDEKSCWCCCRQYDYLVRRTAPEDNIGSVVGQCDSVYGIYRRWIEYGHNTERNAREILEYNWPKLMRPEKGGNKLSDKVETHSFGAYAPSVVVEAKGEIDTSFLKVIGIDKLQSQRCSQATTFYEKLELGRTWGRNPPPADACR